MSRYTYRVHGREGLPLRGEGQLHFTYRFLHSQFYGKRFTAKEAFSHWQALTEGDKVQGVYPCTINAFSVRLYRLSENGWLSRWNAGRLMLPFPGEQGSREAREAGEPEKPIVDLSITSPLSPEELAASLGLDPLTGKKKGK